MRGFNSVRSLIFGAALSASLISPLAAHKGRTNAPRAWSAIRNADGSKGLRIGTLVASTSPVELTLLPTRGAERFVSIGYRQLTISGAAAFGSVDCRASGNRIHVVDQWRIDGETVTLDRTVNVVMGTGGGFSSGASFGHKLVDSSGAGSLQMFVPGTVYGSPDALSSQAIGRLGANKSQQGEILQVREDRLPMPLAAVRAADHFAMEILDPTPDGATTRDDAGNFVTLHGTVTDPAPRVLTDGRFRVGAITVGVRVAAKQRWLTTGFVFPATESPMTYLGNSYPGAGKAMERRLLHPLTQGYVQRYKLAWRISTAPDTPSLMRDSWRWAWSQLKPRAEVRDITTARRSLVAQLSSQVEDNNGLTGITNFVAANAASSQAKDRKSIMGFTGKALETAEELLWAADAYAGDPDAAVYRKQGEGIIRSFVSGLKLDPPAGEGFNLDTGAIALAIPRTDRVYLRSFGDDIKALLRAYRRESKAGRRHEEWLIWCRAFGDWLLTQQRPDGSVPRAWRPNTAETVEPSGSSSYNAIPMWVLLTDLTGDARYQAAAIRAGEYIWVNGGQAQGRFVGGTIDNPDVIDKEAGTLSLEAYLALFEQTHDPRWLARARAAGDFAETWIYGWNVPMAVDDDDEDLHWKRGVPTIGVQLIATGHSLVDEYMSFDVDEFAKLYRYTGDLHYRDVARVLLHGTLAMTALPGRSYDLKGPGWQQEHFSLAPWRGRGLHRGWLPWVSTSHLNGMIGLEEFDRALFQELTGPE